MQNCQLSIILPAFNEGPSIVATLLALLGTFDQDTEIIVVDDGSTDSTQALVRDLQKRDSRIRVLQNEGNQGKGYSLRKGTKEARGDVIAYLDADGDISAGECQRLVRLLEIDEQADMIIGSKRLPGSLKEGSSLWIRRWLAKAGNLVIQALLVKGIQDTQAGLKVFRGSVVKPLAAKTKMKRWSYDIELLALAQKARCRIREEPIQWAERGITHVRFFDYLKTLGEIARIYVSMKNG